MLVEFFQGAIGDNQLVDAVEMKIPPRLGEVAVFNVLGKTDHYEIISVEHHFETRNVDHGLYATPETSVLSMRCGLMAVEGLRKQIQ